MGENRVIGRDGGLPWRLPADLAWFKRRTLDRPVVMGRRTWESLGVPLARRRILVVTRHPERIELGGTEDSGAVEAVGSLEDAIARCQGEPEVMIAGGGEIYRLALPMADRVDLTIVHGAFDGDVTFPELDGTGWRCVDRRHHPADERHAHPFTFTVWRREPRISPPATLTGG